MHLRDLLDHQGGVVARRQLVAAGLQAHVLRRLIRRRELVPVHPGVYVNHTGTPTWFQSAWAAVLACEPAALASRSALVLGDGTPAAAGPIHVAIPWEHQRLRDLRGVYVTRRRGFQRLVLVGSPPRSRVRRREWLGRVLADVGAGTCSVLEHGYLEHVERAHGLPRGARQVRDRISRGIVYRDVDHDLGLVVELDG